MARRRRLKIFISYARSDQVKAYDLYKRLAKDDFDAWIDKASLLPGQVWELEIRKFIRQADVFIVCLSKKFNEAGFRQKEVRLALDAALEKPEGEVFIIPVRLEECDNLESLRKWNWVDLFKDDGYENLMRTLRQRAREIGISLRPRKNEKPKKEQPQSSSEKLISEYVLNSWLHKHGLDDNPFGSIDFKSHLSYPDGVIRPNRWESYVDDFEPLIAHCPTLEDAQALDFLLQDECFPLKKEMQIKIDRHIFPVRVWYSQIFSAQPPLLTLAHSTAQAWLEILPNTPAVFSRLLPAEQIALLELLCWSIGSSKAVINLLQINGLKESKAGFALISKISGFEGVFSLTKIPQDLIIYSWLKIKPRHLRQIYLILPIYILRSKMPLWWFEQFNSLIPILYRNGVITKAIDTYSTGSHYGAMTLALTDINLSWSNDWLKRSLDSQFDAALDPAIKFMVATRFHELFGPGMTEEQTTNKLVSASHNSLARMLMLGNRLLQYHCENRGVSEKYLYVEDLKAILKTA